MKAIVVTVFLVDMLWAFDPTQHENWQFLHHDICGRGESDRIIGGTEAPMNAFPWIARIGHFNSLKNDIDYQCSGTVLTNNIILTAGHCVASLSKNMKLKFIRLGEHDTTTDPDCTGDFCADPIIDITPREVVIPSQYNNPPFNDDIAIIRLTENITFTAFVRPMCLPSGNLLTKDFVGSKAEVAGWGIFDLENGKVSHKLLVVRVPIISNEACRDRVPSALQLTDSKMCAGGEVGKDSCNGDSGGPLMKVDDANGEPRYYILGIVSFGSKKCGKTTMPGVYTRITSYLEWILDNLVTTQSHSVIFPFQN